MKITDIQNLIRFVAKSGVSEIELELKDFKIIIKNSTSSKEFVIAESQPVILQSHQASPIAQVPVIVTQQEIIQPVKIPEVDLNQTNYITIKAPMIGTFYRTSSPDKPPFVNVGDEIKKGQTLCIIEAMKLFNEIDSEVSGKIIKILVDDVTPIEYDMPLFLIDPS